VIATDLDPTDRLITQGRALVRAIEALETIERFVADPLLAVYKRRLRGLVEDAPGWVVERIVGASEGVGDDRMVLWMSDN
jgi:hypothetical protein